VERATRDLGGGRNPRCVTMQRCLFINPPLVLDEDFIDYPYFANHGLLACAGLAARSGAAVEIHDAFAQEADSFSA
jgi:hypothetical protein